MGLGDFAKGIGDAVKTGLTKVGDVAIDVGKDVGGTVSTLNTMKGYLDDPRKWDDIAKGGAKAVEFTAEHPGTAAKIGATIGKKIAVDSVTTPTGIITTGLMFASGGAAAAGKVAEAAKIARGLKVAGEAGEIGKAIEGVSTAGKVVEGAEAASEASKVAEGISAAKVSTADKILGAGVKVGESGALERTALSKLRDPLNLAVKARTWGAERILAGAGEEAPSVGRQVLAGLVQGTSGSKPTQLAGISDDVYKAQEAMWRVRQSGNKLKAAPTARKALKTAANPRQAAFDAAKSPQGREIAQGIVRDQVHQAFKQFEEPWTGQQVMDFGQPKPAGYGGPGYQPQLPLEWPEPGKPGEFAGYTASGGYGELTQPGSAAGKTTATGKTTVSSKSSASSGGGKGPFAMGSRGQKSISAWQGPGREVFGGVTPGFDWRKRTWALPRNVSFAGGAKTARSGGGSSSAEEESTVSAESSTTEEVKNPYVDEPVDLSHPGTMNLAQFPKTKVVPGSTLQHGGGVNHMIDESFDPAKDRITLPSNLTLRQPKQGVLGV